MLLGRLYRRGEKREMRVGKNYKNTAEIRLEGYNRHTVIPAGTKLTCTEIWGDIVSFTFVDGTPPSLRDWPNGLALHESEAGVLKRYYPFPLLKTKKAIRFAAVAVIIWFVGVLSLPQPLFAKHLECSLFGTDFGTDGWGDGDTVCKTPPLHGRTVSSWNWHQ